MLTFTTRLSPRFSVNGPFRVTPLTLTFLPPLDPRGLDFAESTAYRVEI
jgi:hypothetical protein